ncbi:ER membrane protein complex subunit 1 [Tetranychus urticae]|uniref:ER membrane protein complex subunit 1 n=1 Tax=Tetranychus urticae TaxID=32264 RepID=UPI00077C05EA|nr:ER membrane protein complex subunit 1 [Tetranychus urticae]
MSCACEILRIMLLLLIIKLTLLKSSYALYEDQIHKWDWRQQFIGIDVDSCMRSNSETKDLIFCTTGETNVISAINRKGEIAWRNIQEEQGRLIGSSLHKTDGLITVSLYKTKNGSKIFIRKWSQDDYGFLIAENSHFLQGSQNCLVSIDASKSLVNVLCGESGSQLKKFQFLVNKDQPNAKPEEQEWTNLDGSPTDVNLENDCIFVGVDNLVCLTSFSLHYIALRDSRWSNQPLPEALPGDKRYVLERILNQNGADVGYFGLKIVRNTKETERFYLYKVASDEDKSGGLQWLTTFPKIQKVSILTSANEPSHPQFYGVSSTKTGIEISKFGLDWKVEKSVSTNFDCKSHANSLHRFSIVQFGSEIEFIVTFDDQRLASFDSKGNMKWSREEGLSSIIWSQFVSLPYFSASSAKHDFRSPNDFLSLSSFKNRIYSQFVSIQEYIISLYESFLTSEKKTLEAVDEESREKSLVSDVFGFHKLLFIVTKRGKLFVLDNVRNGKIIWTHFDAKLKDDIIEEQKRIDSIEMERGRKCDKIPVISVYLQRHNLFTPKVTIVSPKGYLISYNPLEGRVEDSLDLNTRIKLSMLMHHADDQGIKGIILMNEADKVTFYPESTRETFLSHKNNYYMLVSKQTSEQISGYSLRHLQPTSPGSSHEDIAQRVWSLSLPTLIGSCLQVGWKEVDEHVHSQGKVLADRAVLYKYLNPNLVALINRGEESTDEESGKINVVQFYLLDAITGSIYYSVVHRRASDPVHLVHSENFIIYSFYNEKQRRIEISSLELFEGKEMPPPPPVRTPPKIVEHLSFIFPTGIRAMRETQTIRGITNKHILIALTSGGILSLPKIFFDPRRASFATSKYASSAAAMEEGGVYLPPYIPELPIPSEGIINYNQSVADVNHIYVGVSSLESTCLLFITGLDIYYTRVTPSKTFDILKDDFDHLLIIIVLAALLLFSIATKYLASRKTLNAAWK